ncbi:hypothetical protein [Streptosporangium sp. KLBMP 9127]|nr:hypothetical protein [Streptosporangium sp. KLBMP 9127]
MTGILKKTAIFATVGVALSIIPAAGASASNSTASSAAQKKLSIDCNVGSSSGSYHLRWAGVSVYYTPKNGYDEIDKIEYDRADTGSSYKVRVRIRKDLPYLPDQTLWSWKFEDNDISSRSKDPGERVKYSDKWHVDLKVTFLYQKGIDPTCNAHTRSV